MIRKCFLFLSCVLFGYLLVSCRQGQGYKNVGQKEGFHEDMESKRKFQGIWLDRESGDVMLWAKGDSVYYPDTVNIPVKFWFSDDTLYLSGKSVVAYPVDTMGNYIFKFHSLMGEVVSLERSQNPDDTIYFERKKATPLVLSDVTKKDTVVYYDNERYHCYVYVTPTKQKVYKTSYTDEGIAVENVYFDNVIHICVYKGRVCLYSKDYSKRSFVDLVPDNFLSQAILSNMEFAGVDGSGFQFYATVCIPDGASCYMMSILVDYKGKAVITLVEN